MSHTVILMNGLEKSIQLTVDNVWNVTFHVIRFKSLQLLLFGDTERFNLGEQFTFFASKEK